MQPAPALQEPQARTPRSLGRLGIRSRPGPFRGACLELPSRLRPR